ncbi:MAG TPA: hypothetical protein VJO53_09490 [Candidatus Acidoferrales bacterium]|nr:hypothetical protein [Candidatus Acidoferrales bacterium]
MKRPTAEAALSLGLHPANLLLYLSEMGFAFEDIWPAIEETWIEAVRAKDWTKFAAPKQKESDSAPPTPQTRPIADLGVSEEAGYLLEKLWRNDKWGGAQVSVEAMQKHTHLDSEKLATAIKELIKRQLLVQHGTPGPFSLNPGRRSEIDRIAKIMLSRRA